MNKPEKKLCTLCESPLIELEQVTKQLGNSQFPLSVTTYRCTNDECQKRKDDKRASDTQIRLEREEKAKARNSTPKTA